VIPNTPLAPDVSSDGVNIGIAFGGRFPRLNAIVCGWPLVVVVAIPNATVFDGVTDCELGVTWNEKSLTAAVPVVKLDTRDQSPN
jgi:hypothetical protein